MWYVLLTFVYRYWFQYRQSHPSTFAIVNCVTRIPLQNPSSFFSTRMCSTTNKEWNPYQLLQQLTFFLRYYKHCVMPVTKSKSLLHQNQHNYKFRGSFFPSRPIFTTITRQRDSTPSHGDGIFLPHPRLLHSRKLPRQTNTTAPVLDGFVFATGLALALTKIISRATRPSFDLFTFFSRLTVFTCCEWVLLLIEWIDY